jgi:GNAT superfamily N-acetyltransferase
MELRINPPDALSTLACLNQCFPGWGDQQFFHWAYQRAMPAQPAPDYLVLSESGADIAGSGINYRQVLLPHGGAVTAGIMTGSWTLPAARGRGCFSRMIEESIRLTADRGGALLLAFVTEDNPSCRQLLKAGAASFPTSYLSWRPGAASPAGHHDLRPVANIPQHLFQRWLQTKTGFAHFEYPSLEAWCSQITRRPTNIMSLQRADDFAVMEEKGDTYRLLAYLESETEKPIDFVARLRNYAAQNSKGLFIFSSEPEFSQSAIEDGFVHRPGFITAHVADWRRLADALRHTAHEGASHTALADHTSPWFLGHWRLQSGDRM